MSLKWFHAPRGMEAQFKQGAQLIATGVVKSYMGRPDMTHPEINWGSTLDAEDSVDVGRIVPVYTEIEGVSTRILRKVIWNALEKYGSTLTEDIPRRYLEAHRLPPLPVAVRSIHFPPENSKLEEMAEFDTPAHARFIYEEFLKFEYLILRQRLRMEKASAPALKDPTGQTLLGELRALLPYRLTGHQDKAIVEIMQDLAQPHPMNRLIQGDVGSGKTAVAFLTAGAVIGQGAQAALMAPTEILAEQHFKNAGKLFKGKLPVRLLTGKTSASDRALLLSELAAGVPLLLIGTHALLEPPVEFRNLVYIMIDEQHRFGVEQRRTLRLKGTRRDPETQKGIFPHSLVLTATPIPRTLALTAYGDLSVSTITHVPPGRSPIITKVVRTDGKAQAYEKIRVELKAGHQAYFIYPLVNESEAEGFTSLKSAVAEAENLSNNVFKEFRVGLLHGQLRPDEKAAVMERFQKNEIQILVSTTVVEVGVDVPNATIMAVEHSERFGLSQLHQLRGRVGRGSAQSYCFFFAARSTSETTSQRLEVLEETTDGFKIAEADLEIRGPGEFLGVRQAGGLPFRMANLVRDKDWLLKARDDARDLLKSDPDLLRPDNLALRQYFEREGKLQLERLRTS